ncbi:MAG: hypothetical protein ABI664_21565 [bacterium]
MPLPAPKTAAGADANLPWVGAGPDGGDVRDIGISPVDSTIALAVITTSASNNTGPVVPHSGVYRSTDSAAHWAPLSEFEGVAASGVTFASDGTAYAASEDSVWKSTDAGAHWQRLDLGVGDVARIRTVVIDPSDDATLWACLNSNAGGTAITLAVSIDGGATWTDRTPPDNAEQWDCEAVAVEVGGAHRVIATFNDPDDIGHVSLSNDAGNNWTEISAGLPQVRLYALAFAGTRVLVGGGYLSGEDFGLYASDDAGKNWQSLSDASWPLLAVSALAVAPGDPQTIVAATFGRGINRTTDGGATWQLEVDGTHRMYVNAVRFAPANAGRLLAGAMSLGVLDSSDSGAHFTQTSTGLRELFVSSIASNPLNPDELAVAFKSNNIGGVYASTDHGAQWVRQDVPPTRYSRVEFSPTGVLHAISSGPTSPTQQEGLYRRNGDGTWTNLGPDQGPYFESSLSAILFSTTDPNLILLGGRDFGVAGVAGTIWRSPDAGATWTKVHIGDAFAFVTDFERVAGGDGNTLVASHHGQLPPQFGGVLRSIDGGATWNDSNSGLPGLVQLPNLCQTVATSPALFMSAITSQFDSGVFRSDDGGASWNLTATLQGVLLDIACDPFNPALIYIARNDALQPVMRSTDGGEIFDFYSDGIASYAAANQLLATDFHGGTQLLLGSSGSTFIGPAGLDRIFADGFELP